MSASALKPGLSFRPIHGALLMLGLIVAFAAVSRQTGMGVLRITEAEIVQYRDIRFADRADGSLSVTDADGALISVVEPGQGGFIRGVMRGRARERRLDGQGAELPFRIARHADGRITLEDLATGVRVVLNSFGPTNAEAFARLLPR